MVQKCHFNPARFFFDVFLNIALPYLEQQQRSAQFPLTLMGISKRCAEGKEREKKEFAASHFSNAATRAIAIC